MNKRVMHTSIILIVLGVWIVTDQSPTIQIKQFGDSSVQINCEGTGTHAVLVNSTRDIIVDFNNQKECIIKPNPLQNYFQCECQDKNIFSCNVSIDNRANRCEKFACAFPIESALYYSLYVDPCEKGNHNEKNNGPDLNCALTPNDHITDWAINGKHLNKSKSSSLQIRNYDNENISILQDLFDKKVDGSVVACKLVENKQEDWTIRILHPPRISNTLISGNPSVTIFERNLSSNSNCPIKSTTNMHERTVPLCDAVNQKDTGAMDFVGNLSGRFQLETLFPAHVDWFYIDGFENQTNITLVDKVNIKLFCNGTGNPPPNTTLILHLERVLSTSNSSLHYELHLNQIRNSGIYVCVSSNALGVGNKSLFVNIHMLPSNPEETSWLVVIAGAICAVAVAIFVLFVAKKHQIFQNCIRLRCKSGLTDEDNQLSATGTNLDRERIHNGGIDVAIAERQAPVDEDRVSLSEHAAIAFGYENETYAEVIDRSRTAVITYTPANVRSYRHGFKQNPQMLLEIDTYEDDYSGVTQPGLSFAAAAVSHNKMKEIEHLRSEGCTYSVVNKKKRPDAYPYSVDKTTKPDGIIYSVARQTQGSDDYTYSVVNKPKKTRTNCAVLEYTDLR
ncbi:uncharacterized protein LOC127870492 isoform X2 [Dreissena polymorpha]|uniref:uncharacterized protein LOC127870492 isoform X2 n=1 Tax=Dreissena polymorpha TaxID=45954 RepID=UPI002264972F|nr:uncharacterized protein LOC127870492 isoform X2 [Dreissena polymorpha]XP_052269042.1 uncharacterized protein LOC127870492 isoform X2 [Dreissena polymorpha]